MRSLPPALAGALQRDVLTLVPLTRLVRRDGLVVRLSGHDRDLTVDGEVWQAACSPDHGITEQEAGLAPSTASLSGALSSDAITADDLRAGRWLGAQVEIGLTDWQAPEFLLHIWTGTIASTEETGHGFSVELEGLEAGLGALIGRRFMRQCDARLGDARCGLALDDPRFSMVTTVAARSGDRTITVPQPAQLLVARLAGGLVRFTSGALAGLAYPVASASRDDTGLVITLGQALPLAVEAGDAVVVFIGCDGALATCRDVFANAINHRGCAHMPGPAAAFAGPQTDLGLDTAMGAVPR